MALIPKLFDRRGAIDPKVAKKLGGIERLVEHTLAGFDDFLKTWGAGDFLSDLRNQREEEVTAEDLRNYYSKYYGAYSAATQEVSKFVEVAEKKCARRLGEFEGANWEEVAKGWEVEQEFLRVERPLVASLMAGSPDHQGIRDRMHDLFERFHAELRSLDEQRCNRAINVSNILKRAHYLYERKRLRTLVELSTFVQESTSENLPIELRYLLQGWCKDLEGDTAGALSSFERVVEDGTSVLLEFALTQILTLARREDDHVLSLQALECLESLSPIYLKYHAEVLLLLGQVSGALEKLADYHQRFPDDLDNVARIVEIYISSGHVDEARELARQLEDLHGEHVAVQRVRRMFEAVQGSGGR